VQRIALNKGLALKKGPGAVQVKGKQWTGQEFNPIPNEWCDFEW